MRIDWELTYQDYVDDHEGQYCRAKNLDDAANVTNKLIDEDNDLLVDDSTDCCMWIISMCKREIMIDLLEDRVHDTACWYILLYEKGFFDKDLSAEEKKLMDADIAFIRSKVEIYEVTKIED